MSNTTKVFLREQQDFKEVAYTSEEKPVVHEVVEQKWQSIINLAAKIMGVPSGLIMKITQNAMQIYLKSTNESNPYEVGGNDYLGHGLYCETVIGTDAELLIENALKNKAWRDNPDVKLNMISYYGLPIKWPDGEFFGTICVLDEKENSYSEEYRAIIKEFKYSIEKDLELLCRQHQMEEFAEKDGLTNAFNRRMTDEKLRYEFERFKRSGDAFSICLFDLDRFKFVNDTHGHAVGDEVLKKFSKNVTDHIRTIDFFGRLGGDEFALICPATGKGGVQVFLDRHLEKITSSIKGVAKEVGVSFGISTSEKSDTKYEDVLQRADAAMYEMKKSV